MRNCKTFQVIILILSVLSFYGTDTLVSFYSSLVFLSLSPTFTQNILSKNVWVLVKKKIKYDFVEKISSYLKHGYWLITGPCRFYCEHYAWKSSCEIEVGYKKLSPRIMVYSEVHIDIYTIYMYIVVEEGILSRLRYERQ